MSFILLFPFVQWPTLMTSVLFILSSFPFVYCVGFLFSKPNTASAFGSMSLLLGIVPLMLELIVPSISYSTGVQSLISFVSGAYCTVDTLSAYQQKLNWDPNLFDSFYSWKASGRPWVIMVAQTIMWFGLLFLIEYLQTVYAVSVKLRMTIDEPDGDDENEEVIDEDVLSEQRRLDGAETEDVIALKGLRKVYRNKPRNNVAVRNLSFGVAKSEVSHCTYFILLSAVSPRRFIWTFCNRYSDFWEPMV